jgi:MYXO-CTERM domain-containing protein
LDTTVDGVNVSVSFFDSTAAQAVTAAQIGDVALRKVPEPGVAGLGVAGMGLLVFRRRRGLV